MTFRLRLIVLLPLIALVFAGLTGLGLWQLARGDYKDGLEEERGTRTADDGARSGSRAAGERLPAAAA